MRLRRRLLVAMGGSALAAPWASFGQQQGKIWRIGFMGSGSHSAAGKLFDALREELRNLGYVEGKNIVIEARWAEGKFERLQGFAAELLALKVDLFVTWGTPAGLAAKKSTSTVPIVMVNTGDPVDTGLVATLAKPGGNVTGMSNLGGAVTGKQLELLVQVIPKLGRVAVLRNPENTSLVPQVKGAEAAAQALGLQLQIYDVRSAKDFEGAFTAIAAARPGALLVLSDPLFFDQRHHIAGLALRNRLPSVTGRGDVAEAGVMMAYGGSTLEQFRGGAPYIDKILRGAKPADLPVQQSTIFELVINLKTAKALGLHIKQELRFRADRLIE